MSCVPEMQIGSILEVLKDWDEEIYKSKGWVLADGRNGTLDCSKQPGHDIFLRETIYI